MPAARAGEPGSGLIRIYAKPADPAGEPTDIPGGSSPWFTPAGAETSPGAAGAPSSRAGAPSGGAGVNSVAAEASPDGLLFAQADELPGAPGTLFFVEGELTAPAGHPALAGAAATDEPGTATAGAAVAVPGPPPQPASRGPIPAGRTGPPLPPPGLSRTRLTGQATFDPAGSTRFGLQVLRQAVTFAGIYALVETAALLCFLLLGVAGIGLSAALGLEITSLKVVAVILAVPFWLIPVSALLGQWTMLAEGSANTAKETFQRMSAAFSEHEVPVDSVEVRTVEPPGEEARDYLELQRGRFTGFLACFPHGRDLYLGWTFWLRMSPARLLLLSVSRRLRNLGGGSDIEQALCAESARALVAALHSATLAGADSVPDPGGPPLDGAAGRDAAVRVG